MAQTYHVASPVEIAESHIRAGVHHEFPPAGTTVVQVDVGGFVVIGTPTDGKPGDWWVADTATLLQGQELGKVTKAGAKILKYALRDDPLAAPADVIAAWPWIFKWSEGTMRWIHTTLRGSLGGLEQFQHGMNWGVPGNDPTLAEADAPEYAHTIATAWAAHAGEILAHMSTTHHYLEVGAVQMEQDDPVSKDGTGGNRRQSYPTGWWAWPQGSQPTGGSTLPSLPYEVACAVSLTSDVRGPRGKGRFYLPPFSTNFVGAAPGGLWDADTPASVGGAIGAWIQAVETATGHQALIVSGRAKQLHPVRAVLVGKVPDSQRRRRRSLDEARVTGWTRP